MSEAARAESPLAGVQAIRQQALTVEEVPFLGYLNLRGRPDDRAFLKAAADACGTALPIEPNTVTGRNGVHALWLGPDEWLLVTGPEDQYPLLQALEASVDGLFAGVTDVSGYYTALTVSGDHARALLARSCPIDLHPRAFGPGRCAQSLLAKAGVILEQIDDTPGFRLIVRRSFAEYVWRWLMEAIRGLDAGREA